MLRSWLNRLSDWNPQLTRELRGRLQTRTVLIAIGSSLVLQMLIWLLFYGLLPYGDQYYKYCVFDSNYACQKTLLGQPLINWKLWWTDIFRLLNWGQMFLLMVPGAYLLATDIDQEERRGTLNFIRLSPQSAREVLLGKLLGVPALVYLFVGLIVPMHLYVTIAAKLPLLLLLSYYLLLLAGGGLVYSLSLLIGFSSRGTRGDATAPSSSMTGFVAATLTAVFFVPIFMMLNGRVNWSSFIRPMIGGYSEAGNLQWFAISFTDNIIWSHCFTLANLGLVTYLVWHMLDRAYHMPSATIVSKRRSYGMIAYVQILLIGFCFNSKPTSDFSHYLGLIGLASIITSIVFLALIAMLSNGRQTLLDWTRYRHMESRYSNLVQGNQQPAKSRSLWWDLVWGEKSPSVIAIGINLLIVLSILGAFILTLPDAIQRLQLVLGVFITLSAIALYAVLAQLLLLSKTPRRAALAFSWVGAVSVLPAITGLFMYGSSSSAGSYVLMFGPLVWISIGSGISTTYLFLSLISNCLATVLLSSQLTRQLKRSGESQLKALLSS